MAGVWSLNPDLLLATAFRYNFDGYDWSDIPVDPWEDIHTFNVAAVLHHTINEDWQIFGGGVVRSSGEDDAGAIL